MIERWVSLVEHDRTRPVVSGGLLEMTGRWGPTSDHDQTDVSDRSWNFTGSDWMLGHYAAFGRGTMLRPVIT